MLFSLFFFLLLSCAAAARREVTWYVAAGQISANAALVAARNGSALTGAYLCCGYGSVSADGTWDARTAPAAARAQLAPFAGLRTWQTVGVSNASIAARNWRSGVAAAVASAVALRPAGLTEGLLVDYEPSTNYTQAHAAAYADFLAALCAGLHAAGLKCGMDIASWGVLRAEFWSVYVAAGVDRFTSMTPTYDAFNVTEDRVFVRQALAGLPSFEAGVGSTLADAKACPMQYGWTQPVFDDFVTFAEGAGLTSIAVWRW